MNVDTEKLKAEIVSDLSVELKSQPTFNTELLEAKVNNVIREVMALRGYEDSGYSDERATQDLARYSQSYGTWLYMITPKLALRLN